MRRRDDPDASGGTLGERLVRSLLRLYPRDFRRTYGADMMEAYRYHARVRRGKGGRKGVLRLVGRTALGMVRGAWSERTAAWREGGWMGRVGRWWIELGRAGRQLGRTPLFAALSLLTLGLGVGAFGSVWAVVESVLLEPMPYRDPGELAWVWRDYTWFDLERGWLGGPDVAWMAERDDVFQGVAAVRATRVNLTGRSGLEPREVRALQTSADFFHLLDVAPSRGRGFLPGEDDADSAPVAILGHALWRDVFGGDPDVPGTTIYLDGQPYRVVGILPAGFDFVMPTSLGDPVPADLYVPLRLDLADQDPGSGFLAGLVRIRPHIPSVRVEAALAAVADRVDATWGEGRDLRLWAAPMKEDLVAGVRTPLLAVLGAAALLLLALGANLAVLFLARAATRSRETALRTVLGAGRLDVAATLLGEIAVLTAGGAAAGVVGARWGARVLGRLAAESLPRAAGIGLDATGALLITGVAVAVGLLASIVPVLRAVGTDAGRTVREGDSRGGDSRRRIRGRDMLVVTQVALSIVLLVSGGLLARSLTALLGTDPGFDPGGTLTLRVSLGPDRYADSLAIRSFVARAGEELATLPGIEEVGFSEALPLATGTNQTGIRFPDAPGNTGDPDLDNPLVDQLEVSPGFFRAIGMRLLRGRDFREADEGSAGLVAVIDDVLADRFFPGRSAVGGRLWTAGDTATIVGVVDQARLYDLHRDDRGQVYFPFWVDPEDELYVAVRTGGDPAAVAAAARAVLRRLDPTVPVSEVRTMEAIVRDSLRQERLDLSLVTAFALAALLLAGLGVYGVVANGVVQRRREIGLRMAIGAPGSQVVRMVVGESLRLVATGVAVGLAGAWAASRFLSGLLFGVDPFDPWTYAIVALLLGAVAIMAAWIPARRATHIDPSRALRCE